jgi:hypothetical protein
MKVGNCMSNYIYYQKCNKESMNILKHLYSDVEVGERGEIYVNNELFRINNNVMMVHDDYRTLKVRRKNNYKFLDFFNNYNQRNFLFNKFTRKENVYLLKKNKITNNGLVYQYSINSETSNIKKVSLISKKNLNKKFVVLIMKYYGI